MMKWITPARCVAGLRGGRWIRRNETLAGFVFE